MWEIPAYYRPSHAAGQAGMTEGHVIPAAVGRDLTNVGYT